MSESTTVTEWGVEFPDSCGGMVQPADDEQDARRLLAMCGGEAVLVSCQVTRTRWEPVTEEETGRA